MADSTAWLKEVTPQIFEALSLSDKGSPPPFPLDAFTASLKTSLQQEDLSLKLGKMDFIDGDDFFKGLDKKTLSTPLSLAPLDGMFHLVMGINDVKTLISCMEASTEEAAPTISLEDESVIKGVYTYFITEAIDSVMQLGIYKDLSLKIMDGAIKDLSAFCIEFTLSIKGHHLLGRLLIPNTFFKAFQDHFTFIPPTLDNLEDIPNINIPMSINTGSITLNESELKEVEEGDFLLLRNSFYKPSLGKGSFQMLIGKSPLFQIKLQKNGIKILDYLYFYSEETMNDDDKNPPIGKDNNDEFNFDDDSEFLDKLDDNPDDSFDDAFDDLVDDEGKEKVDDSDIKEEILDEVMDENKEDTFIAPEKTNLSDLSLTIQLEVARFSLSLEELKKMTPGFKLPIHINPLEVNLIISGKSIGTGEIIEVGDALGVKIKELYK